MVKIKSVEEIATKWADVTPGRSAYYEAAVKAAGADWKAGATAGQKPYEDAMKDPKVLSRRKEKITDEAAARYQRNAGELGPGRFREGIPHAKADYTSQFAPYHGVIAAWTPPPRGPRGDPKNYEIVKSIGDALHKKRVGGA